MGKVQEIEYPVFYQNYIDILTTEGDIEDQLESSLELFEQQLYEIDEDKQEFQYAEGKWTIKEIVQHLIDVERVFVYRSLRFSREDHIPLNGFDENLYVTNYDISKRDYHSLLDEFCLLRRATMLMFKGFDEKILGNYGEVDGKRITVRALGYICSGHVLHHLKVIRNRYL